jgi:hypothetical protein
MIDALRLMLTPDARDEDVVAGRSEPLDLVLTGRNTATWSATSAYEAAAVRSGVLQGGDSSNSSRPSVFCGTALVRRLVSFERAAESTRSPTTRP